MCTISTSSHRFKTRALFLSLKQFTRADFFALYTDKQVVKEDDGLYQPIPFDELISDEKATLANYRRDKLRWASKPFLLMFLLNKEYDAVIYVDNDIFFYSSPDFLFEKLKDQALLLTPHYYPADPLKDQIWLEANFRVGLYNAGFIGASKKGKEALRWWGNCCLYNIKKAYSRGLFDDQKYLDLIPVLFEGVDVLRHRGCNVAGWNLKTSVRSVNEDGELRLNSTWPLVFIHYNYFTIQRILSETDLLLTPYWKQYLQVIRSENPAYDPIKEVNQWKIYVRSYFHFIKFKINRLFDGK